MSGGARSGQSGAEESGPVAPDTRNRKGNGSRPRPPVGVPTTVAERLSALIRFPTVSPVGPGPHRSQTAATFAQLRKALEAFYPRVFADAHVEELSRAGILLRIVGASDARPIVLMAHQDVAPVSPRWKAQGWEYPPFSGVIADGFVHGRGALDDKSALVVMLEAVEALLVEGWLPPMDVYLFVGADAESRGDCASETENLLRSRGVTPHFVLDEGGAVTTGAFPGVAREVAVVGVSEKGVVTLELSAESPGGHTAIPPVRSAAGRLAKAIVALEAHPFPGALHDIEVEILTTLAPHVSGPLRGVFGAARFLRPVLVRLLPRLGAEMAAAVRTTVAVTMLEGSTAANVLATKATAIVNMWVAVDWTVGEAVRHVRDIVGPSIAVHVLEQSEPSPVSPTGDDERWLAVKGAVAAAYPEAVTVPYIMLASSDARHLARVAPAVYRFAPLRMSVDQRAGLHGPNEKVDIESLERGVVFYRALLTGPLMGTSER